MIWSGNFELLAAIDSPLRLDVVELLNSAYNAYHYRSRRKSQCCSLQDGNRNIVSVRLVGLGAMARRRRLAA